MLNFAVWDQLLHQYVNEYGRVNYTAWKARDTETLNAWLRETSTLNWADYPQGDQRLALWLNLYNALVIQQVLLQYPLVSIRPVVVGIPNWLAFWKFFQRKVHTLAGQEYSLNDIEHGVIRPQFQDPRIHFALVCAAVGCPWLRNEAYQPEHLQQQLDDDAQRFINNPEKVSYDFSVLYCSQIFKWYQKDFLNHAASISKYVQKYIRSEVNLDPVKLDPQVPIRYLDYDWSLNDWRSNAGSLNAGSLNK